MLKIFFKSSNQSTLRAKAISSLQRCSLSALALLLPSLAIAQIATEPLLTRSAPVKPNFLFVLDDSGSMGGTNVFASHVVLATGNCNDNSALRNSPVNNFLHYDPSKLYKARRNNLGDPGTNAVVNSTSVVTVYRPIATFNPAASILNSELCDLNRYQRIDVEATRFKLQGVNVGTTNPFGNKSVARVDCAGAICTLNEERANIANWIAFHRERISAARTGVGEGFAKVPNTFRLAWTTISVTAPGNIPAIKDYDLSKTDFYNWLNNFALVGGTPLRQALNVAGQYYSSDTNTGPWANKPWASGGNSEGEAVTDHLSCRRSFTMLITDGEWNGNAAGTAAATADVDGTDGPLITHSNGVTTYKYLPGSTDPRSLGKKDRVGNVATYSNTLSDVAMYYWSRDLRAGATGLPNNVSPGGLLDPPFWQNMTTYTGAFGPVGFLSQAQINAARNNNPSSQDWVTSQPAENSRNTIDDLIHTAHNGGGKFLTVSDAETFSNELSGAIGEIANLQYSQAGVAASAAVLTSDTKKFVPTFNSSSWWGNVRMINLNAEGTETGLAWEVVSTVSGRPTGVTTIPTLANRKIFTIVQSNPVKNVIPFEFNNLGPNGLIASNLVSNTSTLMNNSVTVDIVDYIRGKQTKEGANAADFRKRDAILGDIVNSNPVFVKSVSTYDYSNLPAGTAKSAWPAYQTLKNNRTEGVLFVGANDGMLHGFREGVPSNTSIKPGEEVFAFIPRGVMGNLHLLTQKSPFTHKFFVDGPIKQSDAFVSVQGKVTPGYTTRWASIITGSTGAGGKSVFAVDATYPTEMSERSVMWEVNPSISGFANLGHVMNEVETGMLDDGTWVAVFNNGPYGASGTASLFVVNLSNGTLIKEIATNTQTGNGLSGARLVRNNSGTIEGAYAGDIKGNLWRFSLRGLSSAWVAEKLFTTNNGLGGTTTFQPITATPAVMARTDGFTGTMVVFGTGKLYDDTDQSNTDKQTGYGIWDDATFGQSVSTVGSRAPLVSISVIENTNTTGFGDTTNQTGATRLFNTAASRAVNWTTDRGWFIDYNLASGQRTIYPAEPLGSLVRLDTIVPRLNQQACQTSASIGFNFLINPLTGLCNDYAVLDTNKDGKFTNADSNACTYSTDADGEDVALRRSGSGGTGDPGGAGTGGTGGPDCLDLFSIQDSNGQLAACDTPCADSRYVALNPAKCTKSTTSTYRRDWRELFMRQ